jgi:hypothetical protein
VAIIALPRGPRPPRVVTVAAVALTGYAAWSYLTILWADQQADAWDGANRTLLYAALFALFALWPLRGSPASVLVAVLVLAIASIGLVELVKMTGAEDPSSYFHEGRFFEPVGYPNANAALWTMAFFPAVLLAARRELPPALRAALAGSPTLEVRRRLERLLERADDAVPLRALRAVEVLVFPAAQRGTGEGERVWDLLPDSTMTNATVAEAVTKVEGHSVTLKYKDGEKTISVPPEAPVVTFAPGERALLRPGAAVFVPATKQPDGGFTAARVLVGKDGVVPPM